MRKRIISYILALICVFVCTSPAFANDTQTNRDRYIEYINSFEESDTISTTDFMKVIFDLNDIDMSLFDHYIVKRNYIVNSFRIDQKVTRETALIDIMRSFMLIPDPDKINLYPWEDATYCGLTKQELAYISYAKELGITNGISSTKFGFNCPVTIKQIKSFIENINQLEDLSELQTKFQLNYVIDETVMSLDSLCIPLITEYLYSLPDNVEKSIIDHKWSIVLCSDTIPDYNANAIGLTSYRNLEVSIITISTHTWDRDFTEIMTHEFGHVLHDLSGFKPLSEEILTKEKPNLASDYREYANTNEYEYIACSWYYMSIIGETNFSNKYPETYAYINEMLSSIK